MTTGAFYYHFKSKEELANVIIEESWPIAARTLDTYMSVPRVGVERIIEAAFAMSDRVNNDRTTWFGFHLDMAVGHLSAEARQASKKRIEAFLMLVLAAFRDSELRQDITREEAAELLWIALVGAQMQSDIFTDSAALRLDRLAKAWTAALRTIVPSELFPFVEQHVMDTAARYGRSEDYQFTPAIAV